MPAFQYTAMDKAGKEQKGVLEADSPKHLRQLLRNKQLMPLSIAAVNQSATKQTNGKAKKTSIGNISYAEVVLLTRQLAILLSAGMPIDEALSGTAEQSERANVSAMIMAIRSKVLEGHPLATGLAEFPQVFSPMYIATVKAGESSGHLDQVLENLADYTEKQQTIRAKIKQSAIYPALMIIVSFSIVAFLLAYVVPKLVTLFEDSGEALPLLTTIVIAISDVVKAYWMHCVILIAVCIFIYKRAMNIHRIKQKIDAFYLKMPIIGKTLRTINTARYARTFGTLSQAGLPVLEAMAASADVITNIPIKNSLDVAATKVREGINISRALAETKFFPPMSIHLIASGESSGQLDAMLQKAADAQERDVENLVASAVSLFEPVMTLVMGGVILLIVLAVMLPIFALSQTVH